MQLSEFSFLCHSARFSQRPAHKNTVVSGVYNLAQCSRSVLAILFDHRSKMGYRPRFSDVDGVSKRCILVAVVHVKPALYGRAAYCQTTSLDFALDYSVYT